jgi:hypothetical protein
MSNTSSDNESTEILEPKKFAWNVGDAVPKKAKKQTKKNVQKPVQKNISEP